MASWLIQRTRLIRHFGFTTQFASPAHNCFRLWLICFAFCDLAIFPDDFLITLDGCVCARLGWCTGVCVCARDWMMSVRGLDLWWVQGLLIAEIYAVHMHIRARARLFNRTYASIELLKNREMRCLCSECLLPSPNEFRMVTVVVFYSCFMCITHTHSVNQVTRAVEIFFLYFFPVVNKKLANQTLYLQSHVLHRRYTQPQRSYLTSVAIKCHTTIRFVVHLLYRRF